MKQQQERGREQTNILEIYQHMTSARRSIAGAENIVEEYFVSLSGRGMYGWYCGGGRIAIVDSL